MTSRDLPLRICNCNRTMALDARALQVALQQQSPIAIATELCRKDVSQFEGALALDRCTVACTQEAPLFTELAAGANSGTELRFVNIREAAGWSAEGASATPKIAALLALAELPDPEPVPSVEYRSGGQALVIGPAAAAIPWAARLREALEVAVLVTDARGGDLPAERDYPVWSGDAIAVKGWLGAFEASWQQSNPIDLEVCTRCNACLRACPEDAIDFTYQIDATRCTGHRECVKACGSVGAIDFDRAERVRSERFDLVLDLSPTPVVRIAQPPQGYLAPGADPVAQALAATELARMVGEFEKPKYFAYDERICAHSRSNRTGCTACIDVCSTSAIASAGDKVRVEPHLCMGCGGCATVCPSGAMTYAYPRVSDLGARVKRVLAVYHAAGGKDAALLFHSATDGREAIARLARRGKGLPARVIPLEVHHVAAIGLDVMLGATAYGASQVLVLACGSEAEGYAHASAKQMTYGETILAALGYAGEHFRWVEAHDTPAFERAVWGLAPARAVAKAATFNLGNEKRTTLDFALDHLARHAPAPQAEIALGAGAPFGAVTVNAQKCTMCMACVGACPEGALLDGGDQPRLRFIERNCVQCGLCVNTCPENALALVPRLLLTPAAKEPVTINAAEPFHCSKCGKAFATRQLIDSMLGRLARHPMWQGQATLARLTMCADCRVVDLMEHKNEVTIFDVK
jgi:ferredoxin